MDVKRCSHCKQTKLVSEFHRNFSRKNAYQSWCKICKAQGMRDSRLLRPTPPERIRVMPKFCETRYNAKLTNEDVRLIRGLFDDLSCAEIARKFEVARTTISSIKHGKNWYRLK